MYLQAEKIELITLILNTNDISVIKQVKALFKNRDENWWDQLPAHVNHGINESIGQANRGEFFSYDEVKKEISSLLKK